MRNLTRPESRSYDDHDDRSKGAEQLLNGNCYAIFMTITTINVFTFTQSSHLNLDKEATALNYFASFHTR